MILRESRMVRRDAVRAQLRWIGVKDVEFD